jgi:cbb3-type cytochrome oxidase maturation protein
MSLLLVIFIVIVFSWAIRSGQFDDMEGPAYQILMDDDGVIKSDQSDKPKISS